MNDPTVALEVRTTHLDASPGHCSLGLFKFIDSDSIHTYKTYTIYVYIYNIWFSGVENNYNNNLGGRTISARFSN